MTLRCLLNPWRFNSCLGAFGRENSKIRLSELLSLSVNGDGMNIFCDDGSTAVKLAWYDNDKLHMSLSSNSFRTGWKVEGMGMRQTFNYELGKVRISRSFLPKLTR